MLRVQYVLRKTKHSASFISRLTEMENGKDPGLCSEEYKFLRRHIATYKRLQSAYAVKQSDVERARKVAQQCGLEFTKATKRKEVG